MLALYLLVATAVIVAVAVIVLVVVQIVFWMLLLHTRYRLYGRLHVPFRVLLVCITSFPLFDAMMR